MNRLETYSTSGIRPAQKTAYWNWLTWEKFLPCAAVIGDPVAFAGSVRRVRMADLYLSQLQADALTVHRSAQHVAQTREHRFFLHLQLEGDTISSQGGQEWRLKAGEFALADSARPSSKTYIGVRNRSLVVAIPAAILRRHLPCPELMVGVVIDGHRGVGALAADFLCDSWKRHSTDLEPVAGDAVAGVLVDLLACAYATITPVRDEGSVATARRVQVLNFIEAHLNDPELTPARIAASCKISARHLHHLFAGQGETIGKLILRRRLEEAARALGLPSQIHRSVTAIAFDLGFVSLTHFGRAFRQRYGCAPLEYRRQHCQPR